MKVVFTSRAKASLREIALFIARDNADRALSFLRDLESVARQLGDAPLSFPLVPRYEHHGIRRRPYRGYLIFYRVEDDRVAIIDVVHGARDYESLLFTDQED